MQRGNGLTGIVISQNSTPAVTAMPSYIAAHLFTHKRGHAPKQLRNQPGCPKETSIRTFLCKFSGEPIAAHLLFKFALRSLVFIHGVGTDRDAMRRRL